MATHCTGISECWGSFRANRLLAGAAKGPFQEKTLT